MRQRTTLVAWTLAALAAPAIATLVAPAHAGAPAATTSPATPPAPERAAGARRPASANPPARPLEAILASSAALTAALGEAIDLGPIAWPEPACASRFPAMARVTGADRAALAACLGALQLAPARIDLGVPLAAIGKPGAIVAFALRAGKVVAIDAAAASPREPQFPTVLRWWINRELTPTERTRAAIARTPTRAVDAVFKLCHDERGAVMSRRLLRGSGVAGFDAEATAYLASRDQLDPVEVAGKPAAVCAIFAFRYPQVLGDRTEP